MASESFCSSNFSEDKFARNRVNELRVGDYGASLVFKQSTVNGGLAFIFSKIKNHKQEFVDIGFVDKLKRFFVGNEKLKPINDSYFVYYPNYGIILSLYNHDAMKHIFWDLKVYLEKKLNIPDACEFELMMNTKKLKDNLDDVPFINTIRIQIALAKIDKEESLQKRNPFSKLAGYNPKGYTTIELSGLKTLKERAVDKIMDLLNRNRNADHIYVSGQNINGDILGRLLVYNKYSIKIKEEDIFDFDDFVLKAEDFFSKAKDIFKDYKLT